LLTIAAFLPLLPLLGGCDELVMRKVAPSVSKATVSTATCSIQKARQVRQRASQVQLPAGMRVNSELCANPVHYFCSVRQFAPDALTEKSTRQECLDLPELGGRACLGIAAIGFNTRDAEGKDPKAFEPGGEYNRNEYLCQHALIKDGDTTLSLGEAGTLAEALRISIEKCYELLPHLAEHP
jgi:hypothetical protein